MSVRLRSPKLDRLLAVSLAASALLLTNLAQAQPGAMRGMDRGVMNGMGQCPMAGMGSGWMMAAMVLIALLVIAAIAALAALAVFLVRRSRPPRLGHP